MTAAFSGTERFKVVRRIGQGGMGVVYEARDLDRDEPVALKTLRDFGPDALYRFKHEFRSLTDVAHPNLIRLGELLETRGTWFFTMELIRGVDFLTYVRGRAAEVSWSAETLSADAVAGGAAPIAYDPQRLRDALRQLVDGVAALHATGKVHRDIKPQNVLVTFDGRVVLLDFGLVADARAEVDSLEGIVGTVAYMAPEQVTGGAISGSADWYSVGVLLYEALTGRVPFAGPAMQVLLDKQRRVPPPPHEIATDVPPDLGALCEALLRTDPEMRPSRGHILATLGVDAVRTVASTPPETTLVGRDREVSELRLAFEESRRHWTTVVVVGESGIGKSALVHRTARRFAAERPDSVVLTGRCYEREFVPYKAFDGVVDSLSRWLCSGPADRASRFLPRRAALLPTLFPVLARVEAIASARVPDDTPSDAHDLRLVAFGVLRELLARIADCHPLVVCIDDWQWADADSRQLAVELSRPPDSPALLLLLTSRGPTDAALGAVRTISLGGLAPVDAAALARQSVSADVDVALIDAIADESGGHPLYIAELARHVSRRGTSERVLLDDVIWRRVEEMPDDVRRVLEIVCLAGASLPQSIVETTAQIGASRFERAIAELRVASLVRGGRGDAHHIEPYHDRVRETVRERIDPDATRLLHGRMALALESDAWSHERPEIVLQHFEAAGDVARAVTYAVRAAERAAAALAFDRAAELYSVALRLEPYPAERARKLQLARAEALVNGGRGVEAADAFLVAASTGDFDARLENYRRAADHLLAAGHIERGLEVLTGLLAQVGVTLPGTPRRALVSLLWHRTRLRARGLRESARAQHLTRDDRMRLEVLRIVAQRLSVVDNIRAADFTARYLLTALELGESSHVGVALSMTALQLGTQNKRKRGEARAMLARATEIAEGASNRGLHGWCAVVDAALRLWDGDFGGAAAAHAAAERILQDTPGMNWETSTARIFRVFAVRYQGALDDLRRLTEQWLRDAQRRADHYLETILRCRALPLLALADDAPERLDAILADIPWTPPRGGYHVQHWYALEARVEHALYTGSADAILQTADDELGALERSGTMRVQQVRCMARWARGRLALATKHSDRLGIVERTAAQLTSEDVSYAHCLAAMLRAGALVTTGRRDRATVELSAAIDLADACGMQMIAAAARCRLGELMAGDAGARARRLALDEVTRRGVVDATRFVDVYAPGFHG
jgi:eukaryotic-like serine/threonine-protein kinase